MASVSLGFVVSTSNYFLSSAVLAETPCFYHPESVTEGSIAIFESKESALEYTLKHVTKRNFRILEVSMVNGKITFTTIHERGPF